MNHLRKAGRGLGGPGAAACAPGGRLRAKKALSSEEEREGREPPTAHLSLGRAPARAEQREGRLSAAGGAG